MPPFLLARIRLGWGYAVRRLPQSKMRASLRVVPPTTLVGALAYSLARVVGNRVETIYGSRSAYSWAESLRGAFIYVGSRLSVDSVSYGSILKVNYLYRGSVLQGITALPVEVTAGTRSYVDALYVVDEGALAERGFGLRDLERAAWGIVRLGSRESVVSVDEVSVGEGEFGEADEAATEYMFTLREGMEVRGSYRLVDVVDWKRAPLGSYRGAERVVAVFPRGPVRVSRDGGMRVFEFSAGGRRGVVIIDD